MKHLFSIFLLLIIMVVGCEKEQYMPAWEEIPVPEFQKTWDYKQAFPMYYENLRREENPSMYGYFTPTDRFYIITIEPSVTRVNCTANIISRDSSHLTLSYTGSKDPQYQGKEQFIFYKRGPWVKMEGEKNNTFFIHEWDLR